MMSMTVDGPSGREPRYALFARNDDRRPCLLQAAEGRLVPDRPGHAAEIPRRELQDHERVFRHIVLRPAAEPGRGEETEAGIERGMAQDHRGAEAPLSALLEALPHQG